ncbi:MAG: hypothetical protein ACRC9Q_09770, partial [Bacteroidales bacterium]
ENSANSYIIHPSSTPITYSIPITHQNLYWSEEDMTKVVNESTNWRSNVIWSELSDSDLLLESQAHPMHFDVLIKPGYSGNALIGIYNDLDNDGVQDIGEPYLWSYHLWITDYDPDQNIVFETSKFDYPVPSGSVHRIPGDIWQAPAYSVSRIMDRNLGELSLNTTAGGNGTLYYQYGRKDPFPAVLFDNIQKSVNNLSTYSNSIANPATLYTKNISSTTISNYQWTTERTNSSYLWSDDPAAEKSIFDPCPHGWVVAKSADLTDILAMNTSSVGNLISYGDLIKFRKLGYIRASVLELSSSFDFLLLMGLANDFPHFSKSLDLTNSQMVNLNRSSGAPVRCIRRQ